MYGVNKEKIFGTNLYTDYSELSEHVHEQQQSMRMNLLIKYMHYYEKSVNSALLQPKALPLTEFS